MRTLSMEGNSTVRVVEVPDPVPGPGELVVRIAASAICGSEMHGYRGAGRPGHNSGHESAGTVVALGEGVTGLEVGQRVGMSGVIGCGTCEHCLAGRQTWCQNRLSYGSTHAEYVLTVPQACHVLPADVPWEAGVLLTGDGMGVPYHTSTRLADPAIRTVAIFGAGPIGLGNTIMQVFLGRRVIVVEVSPERRALALRLGAEAAIDPRAEDPVERLRALTEGQGPDVSLEAAGRPETLKQCFAAVRTGGTVAMNGEQPAVPLSPSDDFIRRDITALGSWFYQAREVPRMIGLYRQGLPVESLITHHYPLEAGDEAFREFAAGRTGKVLLVMD
jgi:threonine dehydrogenase-like Zn-dependent dehydrogenase